MVLFNGGGGWSDGALEQLRPSLGQASIPARTRLGHLSKPWEDVCSQLGDERTQLLDSWLLRASPPHPPANPLTRHRQEEGKCAAGRFCHKRTLCLSYK